MHAVTCSHVYIATLNGALRLKFEDLESKDQIVLEIKTIPELHLFKFSLFDFEVALELAP